MWHEARRREKATQKLFNDHKKRAGKRREENKVDPSTLLQVQGLKSKINLDPNTHQLAGRSMVVWQGDQKTTIDRFDVRATLSSIPTDDRISSSSSRIPASRSSAGDEARKRHTVLDANEGEPMKKLLNYERYRLVIQNDLNRVSEDKRLGMVARSESLSEAKMRKLERNYFGTSGEAALANDQSAMTNSQRGRSSNLIHGNQQSQFKPQGVAIGFTYGQLGPPSSHFGYDEVDSKPPPSSRDTSTLSGLIDLDDYEDLDLDCVDKPPAGSKLIDATLGKYGLNCDELNLLIETADDKTTCLSAREIIHKLKSLRDKAKQEKASKSEQVSDFYGPTLPPDMNSSDTQSKPKIQNDADPYDDDTPIGQRSPRAADLPDERVDDGSPSRSPASIKNGNPVTKNDKKLLWTELDLEQIPMPPDNPETSLSQPNSPSTVKNLPNETSGLKDLLQSERSETASKHPEPLVERDTSLGPRESRRASTPLAYKRYRRSSRSLSRERSRNRSSSRSSATGSSSSASSDTSSSSSTSSSSETSSSGSSGSSSSSGSRTSSLERERGRRRHGRHKHRGSPAHKRRATSRGSTRRRRSRDHRRRRRK